MALTFAYEPLDALRTYIAWLDKNGFSTPATAHDAPWHHLPVFCGWAEQTVESVPCGQAPEQTGHAGKLREMDCDPGTARSASSEL